MSISRKHLAVAVLLSMQALLTASVVAEAAPETSQGVLPGAQLSRSQEYFERERVARQIAEDRAKAKAKIEAQQQGTEQGDVADITFEIKSIAVDESNVLTAEEVKAVIDPYINKTVALKDLYEIVGKINKLYSDKGYITCKAYLPPQTIKQGVVAIKLIEGRTGKVTVNGNKTTKAKYITNRLPLESGEISNVNQLNEDLLRFNGTNDAQLHIFLQAGEEPGTTDYIIAVAEPKQFNWNIYTDNSGSDGSGEWRYGAFFTARSLTGRRDNLSLNTIFSDGTKSFGAGYSTPLGHSGTKLNLQYSTNSVEITSGSMEELGVKGHAYAGTVGVTQPLVVTDKTRTELSFDIGQQKSVTDFRSIQYQMDDTIKDMNLGYAITNYGKSSLVYQKHSFGYGKLDRELSILSAYSDKTFGRYNLDGFYQKAYQHGQMLNVRFSGQLSNEDYLPSARQFYIGGANTVRGYKESTLGGDGGFCAGVQYEIPVFNKSTAAFVFADAGTVWGDSAYDDKTLYSAGIGIKSTFNKNIYASVTLGVPFKKEINEVDQDSARVHFMVNGQF